MKPGSSRTRGGAAPDRPRSQAALVSPEYVQVSMATAMTLRMRGGKFDRDFAFGGVNMLLSYGGGCLSDCGYCGLARTRPVTPAGRSFIRVEWPTVRTDEVIERMARYSDRMTRACISMITHGHAYADTADITARISTRTGIPVSVLAAPPTLNRDRLIALKDAGADMIGVGLDAVTEDLFRAHRTDVPAGGLRWDKYWEVIADARDIFGPWKVNVHTLVGLGESDADLIAIFQRLRDQQVFSYLFSFRPEPGSRLAGLAAPGLRRWRRIQLARHLVENGGCDVGQFSFDDSGSLAGIGVTAAELEAVVADGAAFMTNGCPGQAGEPGCTRPYGSYRPGEPYRDYPFRPSGPDAEDIAAQLALAELGWAGLAGADQMSPIST
ncbi:MAG: radical SAM protein [Streptosporangiaceae bacterium]